jgi:protein-tyrosine-phosphatase
MYRKCRKKSDGGGFLSKAPRGYMTLSAGTKTSGDINPLAIKVMKEVGIDISNSPKSKGLYF